jgi:hypothetical protein
MKLTKKQLKQIIKEETENAYRDSQQINEFDVPFFGAKAKMEREVQKLQKAGGTKVPPELLKKARGMDDEEWTALYLAQQKLGRGEELDQWLDKSYFGGDITAADVEEVWYKWETMAEFEKEGGTRDQEQAARDKYQADTAARSAEEYADMIRSNKYEAAAARRAKEKEEAEARMTPMDKCMARGESESACEEMLARAAREANYRHGKYTEFGAHGGGYGSADDDSYGGAYQQESTRRKNSKMKITKSQLKRIIEEELKRLLRNK